MILTAFPIKQESRLSTCGDAGEALVDEIQSGAEYYEYLTDDAKEALNYCSCWADGGFGS